MLNWLNSIGKRRRHRLILEREQQRLDFFGSAETGVVVSDLEQAEEIVRMMLDTGTLPEKCVWTAGEAWHPTKIDLSLEA
ncbi:hypothetical protein [Corynebacterium auriscanis]|uniref:hypothetical protein n=1 Tax=Corynebacterium auriscanis TaxID=99807 RepID=UPI003CF03B95